MEAARGSWADVEACNYIKDLNDKTWRVEKISDNRVRLRDSEGKSVDIVRPPDGREVTILVPTEGEARYTLAKALGARVLACRTVEGDYSCPEPATWDLHDAIWHMQRFHRLPVDGLSLDQIKALHEGETDPPIPHKHLEEA